MTDLATRLDPHYTTRFGCAELHGVFLQPRRDRGGSCCTVALQIPEASMRLVKQGMAIARARKARVALFCDTADQAQAVRATARRLLPDHRPVALERARAGAWGLS